MIDRERAINMGICTVIVAVAFALDYFFQINPVLLIGWFMLMGLTELAYIVVNLAMKKGTGIDLSTISDILEKK